MDLFGGENGEVQFTINEKYAQNYEKWRAREFSQHWKDVNGKKINGKTDGNSDSDESSSEDDNVDYFDKPFLKMMAWLKSDDPNKYDKIEQFVPSPDTLQKKSKNKKDKPFVLRDYERNLIVEKGGKLSDDEEMPERDPRSSSPTYVEEQKALKNSFKQVLENSDSEEEEDIGNLFKKKQKTKEEIQKEDDDYKEWLKGRKKELKDKETESELKNLHDYWTDPKLDSDEVFLRDYILNQKYLEDPDHQHAYHESVHDSCDLDTNTIMESRMDAFEKKYNFRFEEPDPEFIKRYPRNAESSLRRKDDRRKIKRQEVQERKEAEKEAKREKIKQLKAIKRKEILYKIEQIKKITGNDDVNLQDDDLEDDFNPEKHDQKMRELFNDDYYQVEEEDKPECPELENELQIENWEAWRGHDDPDAQYDDCEGDNSWGHPDSEAPNFNMDCDYDPKAELQNEILSMTKSKKKQRRKSKFAAALAKQKPVFDPNDKKFEQYFDEYYKLDCEDIIDDIPCRFKYRQTTPNNYGLTVDEILRADVKELNKWCSLKKVVKYKPEHVEKYEVQDYIKRGNNEALKRKILPSLYVRNESEDALDVHSEGTKIKKSKKRKLQENENNDCEYEHVKKYNFSDETVNNSSAENFKKQKKKKQKTGKDINRAEDYTSGNLEETISNSPKATVKPKKFKKEKSLNEAQNHQSSVIQENRRKSKKTKSKFETSDSNIPVSDDRLKAYGINPKKFKNKIKYGKSQNNWN
ncbi:hypothetical protein R5R35_000372 [Gryllus longicercus]|uniref:Protein KRI1 homolog n=1 Tax=Gryllus longicercus TaxID=2509291 RepID=A0AAN9W9L5_9ORTH